jgi:hypothetical protein
MAGAHAIELDGLIPFWCGNLCVILGRVLNLTQLELLDGFSVSQGYCCEVECDHFMYNLA